MILNKNNTTKHKLWFSRRQSRLTLWCPHGLAVLAAPAQRVQVRRHDVAPEVGATVVLVALVPQQQQLAARGDDVGHPVRVIRLRAHAHLQLHTRRQPRLQALVHLKRRLFIFFALQRADLPSASCATALSNNLALKTRPRKNLIKFQGCVRWKKRHW